MALARSIRASASTAEHASEREAALRLLQDMKLERKPTRDRR
jgi:very-short-patch-repair endonuclease